MVLEVHLINFRTNIPTYFENGSFCAPEPKKNLRIGTGLALYNIGDIFVKIIVYESVKTVFLWDSVFVRLAGYKLSPG